jgi:hypothetical protein
MSNFKDEPGTAGSPERTYEFDGTPYVGTWSEAHRYDCELEELAMMSPGDLSDQIDRIRNKRGDAAAQKAQIDAMQKRRDLVASGRITASKPKSSRPAGGHGPNRGSSSTAQRSGASQSGPFF